MDKITFFIRPYNTKEEDKIILDKEMKRQCYLGIPKMEFGLLQPSDVNQQKTDARKGSCDRLQSSEYENN